MLHWTRKGRTIYVEKKEKESEEKKKKKLVKCDIVPYRYVLLGVLMIFFFFFPFLFVVLFHFCTFNGLHLNLCISFKKNLNLFRTFFFLCVCVDNLIITKAGWFEHFES